MNRNWLITLFSFLMAAFLWFIVLVANPAVASLWIWAQIFAVIVTVVFLCTLTINIIKIFKPNASAYLIFGTVAAVTGILIGAYDFYLINFTSGISNGLLAVFLMIIVIPVIVVLLIIDIIVYLVKRHRNKAS